MGDCFSCPLDRRSEVKFSILVVPWTDEVKLMFSSPSRALIGVPLYCTPALFAGGCGGSFFSSSPLSSSFILFTLFFIAVDGATFLFVPHSFFSVAFFPPPRYLWPVRTYDNCSALTLKRSQASFAIPVLKYFLLNFSQMAAARILVGPFFGSCLQHAKLCLSSTVLSTFSASSSSDV